MKLLLDNIRSAYNVGSIIRSCDAFGVKEIYFSGITPDWDDPKVKKTSLGAERNINGFICTDTILKIKDLKLDGNKIVGLEIHKNAVNLDQYAVSKNTVLVVGNEVSGLSEDVISCCDRLLQIPMSGVKESLNVSVATGIALYELTKV